MSNFGPGSVTVTDKRGRGTKKSPQIDGKPPPPWWPFLIEIGKERTRQLAKWGEQHHPDGPVGSAFYVGWAKEYKRINDKRAARGEPNWDKILLEEVFEALAESKPEKIAAELVQVAAVCAAWVEDLNSRA